jgi:hypothetical protein
VENQANETHKLKIAVTSDTHGRQGWIVSDCDIFINAGDIAARGTL